MKLLWRLTLATLALGVCIFALSDYRTRQSARATLDIDLEAALAGRFPELRAELRAEVDPSWARIWLARALLADQLDRRHLQKLPLEERTAELRKGPANLALAKSIAGDCWSRHPARWQAAHVFGAATYLGSSRSRDSRLTSERSRWEQPLLAADALGAGEAEPARFLAAGYLGAWSTLNDDERDRATNILRKAFTDPDTFNLLAERWLRVAPSWEIAVSLVPDTSKAWARLAKIFKQRQDQQRYRQAEAKRRELLEIEVD